MKKIIILILTQFIILFSLFAFSSCDEDEVVVERTCEFTLNSDGKS